MTADALKESAGGLALRLAAAAPEAAIRSTLSAIAGVRRIAVDPDGGAAAGPLFDRGRGRPSLAAEIVAALVGGGIAVSRVAEIPPDLERVFLDLTRGRHRAAA